MEKSEYLAKLKAAVEKMHGCQAEHSASVPVREVFQGKTIWKGIVEQFNLTGHPKARRAYAWSHLDGPADTEDRYHAVLELPSVESAQTAVRISIVADLKRIRGN